MGDSMAGELLQEVRRTGEILLKSKSFENQNLLSS
jgi:hypothetical protein